MRLVGFNRQQIRILSREQLATFVEEENAHLMAPRFGQMPSFGETTVIMLSHSGKENLVAKIYEYQNNAMGGVKEVRVQLYNKETEIGEMHLYDISPEEAINYLVKISLSMPASLRSNDFVVASLSELINLAYNDKMAEFVENFNEVLASYRNERAKRLQI